MVPHAAGDLEHASRVPVVRVPWLEPGILMKGARCRRLRLHLPDGRHAARTRRTLVACDALPAAGHARLRPGARAAATAAPTIRSTPTTRSCVFAMIESRAKALDNLDEILSVEGVDAIYIGPSDLSLALGCKPAFDDLDPEGGRGGGPHPRRGPRRKAWSAGIHNGSPRQRSARIDQGLPVRHGELGRAPDGRRRAAGAGADARCDRPCSAERCGD